ETGPVGQVLRRPREPYSRALIAAVPATDHRLDRFRVPDPAVHAEAGVLDAWLRAGGAEAAAAGPLVALDGVTKQFVLSPGLFGRGRRLLTAVDEVSCTIARGEILGLVGESGSGKSTLAQVVAGLHRPSAGTVWFGERRFEATTPAAELRAYRTGLQMIFQDPYSSLNRRLTVRAIVAEPIRTLGLAASAREEARVVSALLERVGLPSDALHRHPHAFSGGQRQRIAIARALAARPRFLVCDEPTSALDVSIQAQILNLLKDLRDDLGLAMLFITHDLAVVRQMCDRIGVMRDGRLLELAASEQLFEAPREAYTRELIGLLPDLAGLDAALEPG
ncbi:MAG: ATP-binding cassette domain-containing protein, partial [Deinococcus-Thermus bacterium]|nr:ATP-binding cassette domain-containing protein [Deinococcota bacterium]